MSVRAYKVDKIEHEEEETFNLWHDEDLMEVLENEADIEEYLTMDGGLIELSQEQLETAYQKATKKETSELLEKMIKQAKDNNGYVKYYCF